MRFKRNLFVSCCSESIIQALYADWTLSSNRKSCQRIQLQERLVFLDFLMTIAHKALYSLSMVYVAYPELPTLDDCRLSWFLSLYITTLLWVCESSTRFLPPSHVMTYYHIKSSPHPSRWDVSQLTTWWLKPKSNLPSNKEETYKNNATVVNPNGRNQESIRTAPFPAQAV